MHRDEPGAREIDWPSAEDAQTNLCACISRYTRTWASHGKGGGLAGLARARSGPFPRVRTRGAGAPGGRDPMALPVAWGRQSFRDARRGWWLRGGPGVTSAIPGAPCPARNRDPIGPGKGPRTKGVPRGGPGRRSRSRHRRAGSSGVGFSTGGGERLRTERWGPRLRSGARKGLHTRTRVGWAGSAWGWCPHGAGWPGELPRRTGQPPGGSRGRFLATPPPLSYILLLPLYFIFPTGIGGRIVPRPRRPERKYLAD
jgi:hypothetical protein